MKKFGFIMALAAICCFDGCAIALGLEVEFWFFNISTNKIRVDSITGISPEPPVGNLRVAKSDHNDNSLQRKSAMYFETVRFKDRIKITWTESGTTNIVELDREKFGLPAKTANAKIKFSYLGNDEWRVRMYKEW